MKKAHQSSSSSMPLVWKVCCTVWPGRRYFSTSSTARSKKSSFISVGSPPCHATVTSGVAMRLQQLADVGLERVVRHPLLRRPGRAPPWTGRSSTCSRCCRWSRSASPAGETTGARGRRWCRGEAWARRRGATHAPREPCRKSRTGSRRGHAGAWRACPGRNGGAVTSAAGERVHEHVRHRSFGYVVSSRALLAREDHFQGLLVVLDQLPAHVDRRAVERAGELERRLVLCPRPASRCRRRRRCRRPGPSASGIVRGMSPCPTSLPSM